MPSSSAFAWKVWRNPGSALMTTSPNAAVSTLDGVQLPPGFRSCWAQKALGSADLSTDEAQKWVRGAHQHRYYGDAHIVLTR